MRERDYFLDPGEKVVIAEALTNVPLKLDLRDPLSVVELLRSLIYDESSLNQDFLGVVVCGSFSHGCANSESDLDVCYVVANSDVSYLGEIKRRIKYIFGLYDIKVDDIRIWREEFKEPDIVLEEIKCLKTDQLQRVFPMIDRDSKFLIKDTLVRQTIMDLFDISSIEPNFPAKKHKDTESPKKSVRVLDFRTLESGIPPWVRRY